MKEFYIEVHRIYKVRITADTEAEALDAAFENAEAMNNGIADDYFGNILKVKEIEEIEEIKRKCNCCGKVNFSSGYCIDDGLSYYCSDKCLFSDFAEEEYLQAYEEDWAYYTTWSDNDE